MILQLHYDNRGTSNDMAEVMQKTKQIVARNDPYSQMKHMNTEGKVLAVEGMQRVNDI